MPEFNHEKFGQDGLGLDSGSSVKYGRAIKKVCVLAGLAAGAGLALTGLKDMGRAGQGYAPPAKLNWLMVLAGLGVGTLVVGGSCTVIKNKILDFVNQYESTEAAILALTPQKKVELRAEAIRLVQMSDNIEKLFNDAEQEQRDSKYFA